MEKTSSAPLPHVIGVGASAGGLEALLQLLDPAVPPTGFSFIIVQHLAPDHRSLMVDLLANHTKLAVRAVADGLVLAEDTVYVIQPQTYVRIKGRRLQVEQAVGHVSQPIDELFFSLAKYCESRCAGVVLSGTGRDGAEGLVRIKEAGGTTIAQRPDTARFDGMPQAALATGCVDLMLAPNEIVAELKASQMMAEPLFTSDPERSLALLGTIFAALRTHTGIDFSHYKPGTIARRVERRVGIAKSTSPSEYAEQLKEDRDEARALQRDLLIGVTAFMRDSGAVEALQEVAIPRLLSTEPDMPLRAWVAGCSTGEEAYSIAMLLDNALQTAGSPRELKVFATDIDEHALESASQGRFSDEAVQAIPFELQSRYLRRDPQGFVVTKKLREKLLFSRHNVVTDPPFPRIHLVTCRNLLIYLKPYVQQRVLHVMSNALVADGLLWLGASESLGELAPQFEVLDQRWKIFAGRPNRPRMTVVLPTPTRREPLRAGRQRETHEIAETLLRGFLPPTIVTDENLMLAYRYGDLDGLLKVPVGRASLELRDMLPHQVAVLASIACQRVSSEQEEVIYRGVVAEISPGKSRSFDLRARPLRVGDQQLVALMFDRLEDYSAPAEDILELGSDVQRRVTSLERELRDSQATLQSTVEELESSNEELQATNEELVASNEELQSVNEELQSVNEELHTVNAEHTQRLDELVQITHDLDQLLSTLDVGIIFLDDELCIRRFNARASCYVNILLQDVGRPLGHLTHSLEYPTLLADCKQVVQTGTPMTRTTPWKASRVRISLHAFNSRSARSTGLVLSIAEFQDTETGS